MDISDLDHAVVLAALYNGAQPQGMGFMHYTPDPMSVEEAKRLLAQRNYFDYWNGRVMKVRIENNLDTRLYNRDNGENAAEEIVEIVRETNDPTDKRILDKHAGRALRQALANYYMMNVK